jgi:hypothetical protein
MAALFSTTSGVAVVDTRTRPGTITLPLTTQIPNRYLQIKDLYGSFGVSSLTLSTQTGESFDDRTTSKILTDPFSYMTLYAASTGCWAVLGATQTIQQTVSSLVVSSITIGSGIGWLQLPPIQTVAVSTNTIYADTITTNSTTSMYISAQILYVSSIMGAVVGAGNLTTSNLTSTVGGLGQIYLSTAGAGSVTPANLTSTVGGLGQIYLSTAVAGGVTPANLISTTANLQSAATGFVSALTVNALTLGTGAGWLQLPPVQTLYASTTYLQGQALFSLSSYFGTTSTATALQYTGLFGNFNNTVLAEVSTGAGTQEFLVFKGSSSSDRVRVQTTGNFVVETGVSARLWDGSTVPTQSNATPAFIINTSSNVGIQTATPGATLDVAGTGRFQTVSTLAFNVSSINGASPGGFTTANAISTVTGLGSAGYVSSLSLLSTTGGLQTEFGTAGFLSSLNLLSTIAGLGSSDYISTLSLTSTVAGLGQIYLSSGGGGSGGLTTLPCTISTFSLLTSSILASTIQAITLSSQLILTSTIFAANLFGNTALLSTVSTSAINFASGYGYLTMPDILPNTVYTSTVTTSNLLVGWNATVSPIQFYGFGSYSNTVIAELSTGTTTQDLVLFRGSNSSDRIRFQTTGSVVFEPGVSARLWPSVPSNVTPAMILNTSSNVGIQIAAPTVPLDVAGAIRGISFSTQQIATSSIINNPRIGGAFFTSSMGVAIYNSTFLGGAVSTSFMTAGTPEVDFFTNNTLRMTILSNGFVGINTGAPSFLFDVVGTGRFTTLLISSMTAFNNVSTVQLQTSSLVGDNVQGTILSSFSMGASTFTGRWNDAQYYVLQTI